MRTPYWNPRTESLPREQLEALQLRRLRDLVDWTLAAAPWQGRRLREAGIDSSDVIRIRDDLRRIPFLTRDEWMESQAGDPPFGEVLTQPVDAAIRYHTTSAGGNMTTEARVRMLGETGATVVCSTPTYALRMAQEAESLGIDLAAGPVKKLVLSGEPAGSIPATKALIEEQWGAETADTAGMTEVGTIVMFECDHHPGGAHLIEGHYLEETVDPESGEPLGYDAEGERVVTSFGRGFIPVLRYRTRDLVRRVPAERCSCGRTFDIYEGGIRGRADDMKVVRGTNIYPRAIEEIVHGRAEIEEFQVRLYTEEGIRDEVEVLVECTGDEAQVESILGDLRTELARAHEGLRIGVRQVESESLPRFELKAKRLVDEREVWGGKGERKAV